jgi:membrane protease YdiL (CAAX protease family)
MTVVGVRPLSYGAILFLLCFGVQLAAFVGLAQLVDTEEADNALILNFASQILACLVGITMLASLGGRDDLYRAGLNLKGAIMGSVRAAAAYPLFLLFFLFAVVPLNELLVGKERQELVEEIMTRPELLTSIPFILLICLGIPLLEEFLFRGILYPGLRCRLSIWPAILFSALVFGILHGINAALPILAFGCYLGIVREKNESLLPAVVVHALHNSCTLLFIHLHLLQ